MSLTDELQKLQSMCEHGVLAETEFTAAKKRLLESESNCDTRTANHSASGNTVKPFCRSIEDRWIGGVCGGLAEVSGMPAWMLRLLCVLLLFIPVPGVPIVIYALLWIFVPSQRLDTVQYRRT